MGNWRNRYLGIYTGWIKSNHSKQKSISYQLSTYNYLVSSLSLEMGFKSRTLTKLNASQSQCMIWEGKVYVHTHKIYCTLLVYCNLLLKCLDLLLFLFRYFRRKFKTSQRIGKWYFSRSRQDILVHCIFISSK